MPFTSYDNASVAVVLSGCLSKRPNYSTQATEYQHKSPSSDGGATTQMLIEVNLCPVITRLLYALTEFLVWFETLIKEGVFISPQ